MTERILVIEDDPALAKNLMSTLVRCGFKAEEVNDGKSAIEKIATGKFDLALLDLMIPQLNGYEVLKQIQRQGYSIPVIVVSAKMASMTKRMLSISELMILLLSHLMLSP